MKHATLMYTCMGLMGAAAIIGSIDYAAASKSGKLRNLYKDDVAQVRIVNKQVDVDDYSRGEPDYDQKVYAGDADTSIKPPKLIYKKDKKLKGKKIPPPPVKKVNKSDIPPPPPPKADEVAEVKVSDVLPVISEVIEGKVEVETKTEVGIIERFSRAPLPKVRKTSKNKN